MKPVQYFNKARLEETRKMTPTQIANFLEDFRLLHHKKEKSILISLRVPESLLKRFREHAAHENVPYQKLIKELMEKAL